MSAAGIGYHDENGTMRAVMKAGGILFLDENGEAHASISEVIKARGFWVVDENGTGRASMSEYGFIYVDENGKNRASLGIANLVTATTGARMHYPAAVVLYKADGTVLWQQPR